MATKTNAQLQAELEATKAQLNNNLSPFDAVRNLIDACVIGTRMIKSTVIRAETVVDIAGNGLESSAVWFDTKVKNEIEAISAQTKL